VEIEYNFPDWMWVIVNMGVPSGLFVDGSDLLIPADSAVYTGWVRHADVTLRVNKGLVRAVPVQSTVATVFDSSPSICKGLLVPQAVETVAIGVDE
jgi:hypothetical protein